MRIAGNKERFLLINGLIGIGLMVALSMLFKSSGNSAFAELRIAAENMKQSLKVIEDYCIQHQINTDNPEDPRHTGLIGPEWSELTTTVGDPEAKRTTINPNFAALIAHLLKETGVKKGDTIAIGSSASFPALLIASLSAAKALELNPVVIISFGSSSFGASNPDFTFWDLYHLLLDRHMIDFKPVAASIGGEDDTGLEFDRNISDRFRRSLEEAGIPLITEKDLQINRSIREKFYFAGNPHRIKAFINSGGGFANLGSSQAVLNIKPGLVRKVQIPEPEKQGMIHTMLLKKIPVIHLLFIKGLAQKYNLPWDPASQPQITQHSIQFNGRQDPAILIFSLIGLLWFILVLMWYRMLYNSH
ncbi:MAG: poly-gamma-glutamate system protein [Bacteroidales bacterium]